MLGWAGAIPVLIAGLVALGVSVNQHQDELNSFAAKTMLKIREAQLKWAETLGVTGAALDAIKSDIARYRSEIVAANKNIAEKIKNEQEAKEAQEKFNQMLKESLGSLDKLKPAFGHAKSWTNGRKPPRRRLKPARSGKCRLMR